MDPMQTPRASLRFRTLLVTGGAGFIGSNFVRMLRERAPDLRVVNLDLLTYAGNPDNLEGIEEGPTYRFVQGDIGDAGLLIHLFSEETIDAVVHFAAESHVDRSIEDPAVFARTNLLGTQALMDAARAAWQTGKGADGYPVYREGVKYLQVSTDEVYGTLGKTGKFQETTPLAPNSPYSASKAAADLMVRAYHETFHLPMNITRCSNNYGPHQFPEKLIPLIIRRCMENGRIPVYGDGQQVRDWLHVEDHCTAIWMVLRDGTPGDVYNVGGDSERANMDIVKLVLQAMDKPESLISFVEDRLGHDRRYAIDHRKITSELGWKPARTFEEGMAETIRWYRDHTAWMERVVTGAYRKYQCEVNP